ncbi:MAG: hypothetical protein PBV86_23595 [Delftia lacustris]|jgi:hypothetical protein|uniref:hypothetical protein n=1 Tax=Delftia TaxID=80865 RepID=UPI0012A98130|nr:MULTISPECIES: hypothetical protein [Delftia]QFS65807.1 hypothetical protein GCS91_16485 [Delftia tsuruhatensis]WON87382.1 hypothetical protein OK021_21905 [Delftia sp. UGAL515B_04]
MNSIELSQEIDNLFSKITEAEPFLGTIYIFSKYGEATIPLIELIAISSNHFGKSASEIHTLLANFPNLIANTNNRKFFYSFDVFSNAIELLIRNWPSNNEHFSNLQRNAENFANLYDHYLSQKSGKIAYQLILLAQHLDSAIKNTLETLASVRAALIPQNLPNNNEAELTLTLPEDFNLSNFALRLISIQKIYSELCALYNVSEIDFPLRIQKIESGSLWASLFGNTAVIESMAFSFKEGIRWIYRNYTIEGKITNMPLKVEAIDNILGLTKRLEEAGIETEEIKKNIEKSALMISKELSVILDGQSSVTLNKEKIALSHELEKKLTETIKLPSSERKQLNAPDTP